MRIDPDRLRRLRVQRGLSVRELSRRAGVSHGLVSMLERGESSGSPASARKLADALGVSVDDLWSYDD